MNCLSVFDHFVGLVVKVLISSVLVSLCSKPPDGISKDLPSVLTWWIISDVLRNLVLFVQFKKRKKYPWGSVSLGKVAS